MVPSNAGAWVPMPSAVSTPVTPSGRSLVSRVSFTPLVSSRFVFAAAKTSFGVASDPPPSSLPPHAGRGGGAPAPPADRESSATAPARTDDATRCREITGSPLHTDPRRDRAGAGDDRLG